MLKQIQLKAGERFDEARIVRSGAIDESIEATVADIIATVRAEGDAALLRLTERFDGAELDSLQVSEAEVQAAYDAIASDLLGTLKLAAARIRDFHERQREQSWFTVERPGVLLGQKVTPLARVGIYVPGGRANYPSTVLMNAVPAAVAGAGRIAMATPPARDGSILPATLVAADLAGVNEIYKVGGAQAIAAFAYGTPTIAAVDKITGPGNAWVAAAKKLVQGRVGIDMIAGPSEVLVLADATARAPQVAIDLMAQAEHDPRAAVFLVTTQAGLIAPVEDALEELLERSPREEITRAALTDNSYAIVCADLEQAVQVCNVIAPEHLEVLCAEPFELLGRLDNAGAIFLGPWTPEPVGDYLAGPNHTLPTQGTARFSSPLTVDDFVKRTSVLQYSQEALRQDSEEIRRFAAAEGLWAHGEAVRLRVEEQEDPLSCHCEAAKRPENAPVERFQRSSRCVRSHDEAIQQPAETSKTQEGGER